MTDGLAQGTSRFSVDTNKNRLDVALIHRFLSSSYWAKDVPIEVVRRSIQGSLCFGVYEDDRQIGFARVVSDSATFAYLADVFILETHRGRGLSKVLMASITDHPDLQDLRRWLLSTRDAHSLYSRYGFTSLAAPDRVMERHSPKVYSKGCDGGAGIDR
ncbi:MAG: GNAT family N-acetyltransferase [Thermoanaerobaculia bacterium]|nr:GNAT family N-acetyltransferase [Thermoanaerobaculia bacterium]